MIDGTNRVTQVKVVRQVVRIKQGNRQSIIERQGPPRLTVVRTGVQGPVGTVADEVLSRAEAAEQAANNALTVANQATADLDKLITDMNDAFVYHTGVISAQGG
ncbi:hypothetical protein [Vibrio parahaemolyticus]|uniref:hypothetical protein n=1 Tax=Vibrio parahaemolyticus TaxID=670 RepID=UPI001EEB644E|nr:hypothetical protein [Vibrio parahaemolyticus]MCG6428404.1 hypothetical protein [Vibrio parahaemolyticus]HCE2656914.1 hypothetical protein [Vibrio parahaemolyticus]HCE2923529.1 hypothetical protein [Vibrio parahaemolyticus]HCH1769719.1 hypothetical protein [Vibrio parahaemolyticus]HCH5178724.1 hypothetical protein [Vibrio parahaemolyticus]